MCTWPPRARSQVLLKSNVFSLGRGERKPPNTKLHQLHRKQVSSEQLSVLQPVQGLCPRRPATRGPGPDPAATHLSSSWSRLSSRRLERSAMEDERQKRPSLAFALIFA